MDADGIVQNSATYRFLETVRNWVNHSTLTPYVCSERVQLGFLVVVLLSSFHSITGSEMDAVAKFLSFVIVFLLTAIATWSLTDPLATDTER